MDTNNVSIASSAMLVELNISMWGGTKTDSAASAEVTINKHASKDAAKVIKTLINKDNPQYKAINTLKGTIRSYHYGTTLPWLDSGVRLLPTSAYFKYQKSMTGMINEFNDLVQDFVQAYEWEIHQSQYRLGDLFDPQDYPSHQDIIQKCAVRISYMPVPEAGDFRLDVTSEAQEQLKASYEAAYTAKIEQAMGDVWKRVHKCLSSMSDRLTDVKGKRQIFRDSLIENAIELVEVLGTCNITNNPEMSALKSKLQSTLHGLTPEALREDPWLRADTKQSVDEILKTLPSLDI
jgi:hypothetical protein